MNSLFTKTKEFVLKQVSLTTGVWTAHLIVCPLRAGGTGGTAPLCGKQ